MRQTEDHRLSDWEKLMITDSCGKCGKDQKDGMETPLGLAGWGQGLHATPWVPVNPRVPHSPARNHSLE